MDAPRYRIEHRFPDGLARTLATTSSLTEAHAMLAPLLVQLADGRYAGAVAVVDRAADPEADVLVREIGAVAG